MVELALVNQKFADVRASLETVRTSISKTRRGAVPNVMTRPINRNQLLGMILKECPPVLRGRFVSANR
jgi:hypothetical protein